MNEEIILKNTGLIIKVMRDLNCQIDNDDDFEEYYFAGLLGLMEASKTYDSSLGKSSYLYNAIRNKITNAFRVRSSLKRYDYKNISPIRIEDSDFDNSLAVSENFENELITKIFIHDALNKLPNKKYKKFLCEYYGINSTPKTFMQIAKENGVSKQNVMQGVQLALKHLRKIVKE